ncbi:endonuclease VII domain-containing protein [Mycobacterium sp.]|uniref:endonuclease VII domain-containing protein n=1 Tax=Mycobacterium sp. TaxID=1785 RepID=UPI0025DFDE1C|nr:endonuclease VII domain-containing protein [Mycobacterium sp.]
MAKDVNDFRETHGGRWRSSHCKECAAAYLRDWRERNADRLRTERRDRYQNEDPTVREQKRRSDREAYAKDPDRRRDSRLRCQFGITLSEYRAMEDSQSGVCAICGLECVSGRSLAVDHDHGTGEVRGLLCANCNRAIGLFKDDPGRLMAAAAYLLSFQDVLNQRGIER